MTRRSRSCGARFQPSTSSSSRASTTAAALATICSFTPASGPGWRSISSDQSDLRWIREPFLFDDTDHGLVVVHGHTITPEVEVRPNRIGIDTGAYRTGVLTALAIEGHGRWLLDTRQLRRRPGESDLPSHRN